MKKPFICLLLFIFLPSFNCFSANIEWEEGYVITHEGDTIRGLIGYVGKELAWKSCLFKINPNSDIITYTSKDIKSYGLDFGLNYEALSFSNSEVNGDYFAQCLVKGIFSLYYVYIKNEQTDYKRYVALNEVDKKLTEWVYYKDYSLQYVGVERTRRTLSVLLGHISEIQTAIQKIKGDEKELINLFKTYHDIVCNEYECLIYMEPKRRRSFWLTASIGNQLNFAEYSPAHKQTKLTKLDYSPNIGIQLSMNIDKHTERLLLNLGFDGYKFDLESEGRYARENQKFKFSSFHLANTITIEYNWKTKPYFLLEGGIYQMITFPTKNDIKVGYNLDYQFNYRKWTGGVMLGVGYNFPISTSTCIPLKIQYRKPFVGKILLDQLIEHDILSLTVGYKFKL